MFADPATRLARAIWGGVDLLVEFATLGEYRLPEQGADAGAAWPGGAPSRRDGVLPRAGAAARRGGAPAWAGRALTRSDCRLGGRPGAATPLGRANHTA